MKRLILILSLIVFTTLQSQAQTDRTTASIDKGPILKFYPNPAITVVNFDFQKTYDKGYTIQVFNFLGKKMHESLNVTPKTTINLSDFTRGVYIYQLRDKTGRLVESGKFQVSK